MQNAKCKINMGHSPVLLQKVLEWLRPRPGDDFIDATVGWGGHSQAIVAATAPVGRLLGVDWDKNCLAGALENLTAYGERVTLAQANFRHLQRVAQKFGFTQVRGIVFDLGFASSQLATVAGLSFEKDGPLVMSFTGEPVMIYGQQYRSIGQLLKQMPEKDLARLLYQYGDVRYSWAVARRIKQIGGQKPLISVSQLVTAIGTTNPKILAPIFQALRIAINNELDNLQIVLPQAIDLLQPGGRLVVISFHSGEDRIVKNFFREESRLKNLTSKPVVADREEVIINPRSRSAKLRVAEKVKSQKSKVKSKFELS